MYQVLRNWTLEQYDLIFEAGEVLYAEDFHPDVIAELMFDGIVVEIDELPEDEPEVTEDDEE